MSNSKLLKRARPSTESGKGFEPESEIDVGRGFSDLVLVHFMTYTLHKLS